MYTTSLSIILSVLVGYCTVFSAAAASKDCFKQKRNSYTKPEDGASIISAPIACSKLANATCQLPYGGFLNQPRTLSISSTHTDDIFDLIGKVANTEFKKSIYGAVPNGSYAILPGQTGQVDFTQILECYDGTIVRSQCFDDVPAGTSVTACRPFTLSGKDSKGVQYLNGVAAFVTTGGDPEVPPKSTDNPAANTKPDGNSGAVRLFAQGDLMMMITLMAATIGIGSCSVLF